MRWATHSVFLTRWGSDSDAPPSSEQITSRRVNLRVAIHAHCHQIAPGVRTASAQGHAMMHQRRWCSATLTTGLLNQVARADRTPLGAIAPRGRGASPGILSAPRGPQMCLAESLPRPRQLRATGGSTWPGSPNAASPPPVLAAPPDSQPAALPIAIPAPQSAPAVNLGYSWSAGYVSSLAGSRLGNARQYTAPHIAGR